MYRATYLDEMIVSEAGNLLKVTTALLEDADTGEPYGALVPVVTLYRPETDDEQ